MADAFGIGDIVQLKSGSCDMVVEGFEAQPTAIQHPHAPDRLIRCVWMADGVIQSYVFAPHLLVGERKTEPEVVREDLGRTLTAKERAEKSATFSPAYPPGANRDVDGDPSINREVAVA